MRMAGLPQRGQFTMVLSFHGRGRWTGLAPGSPPPAAPTRAERPGSRGPSGPAAAQDAGALSVASPGRTEDRLGQGMRVHLVSMMVQPAAPLAGSAHGQTPALSSLAAEAPLVRMLWLGRTSPGARAGRPFLDSSSVARLAARAQPR
jgi:hypothetical protein